MFKYYTSGEYRKQYCSVEQLQILSANKHNINYTTISQRFLLNNKQNRFLISSLDIMKREKITSQKCVKFLTFVHAAIQNSEGGNLAEIIMPFLSHLLKVSQGIITKESAKSCAFFTTEQMISARKSPVALHTIRTSNRNSSDKVSKELYLNLNIVKPYITYLFKVLSVQDFYNECKSGKMRVDFNEAWVLLNLLKLIEAEIRNYQHIGRYYFKEYASIVVMLTECFSRDIDRFYPKIRSLLSETVQYIEYQYSLRVQKYGKMCAYENLDIENIDQSVKMLEEVSNLNETLFTLYMNKYFFSKIQHIQPPNWIETTDKEYDLVFYLWKIKNKVQTERVRRGLKQNQSLFQNMKAEGSKIEISRADITASIAFVKRMEIPEISFRKKGK